MAFHLLVPGGKWLTWIASPVSSANWCGATFKPFTRYPLRLPPPSAVIRISVALGYALCPMRNHYYRMLATAKSAVSWSILTFTQPVLLTGS